MKKHLFVPYELALIAKEKGFPNNTGSCLAAWEIIDETEWLHFGSHPVGLLSAPLYQQIIDWLFEKHNIWITVKHYVNTEPSGNNLPYGFTFFIEVEGICEVGEDKTKCFEKYYTCINNALDKAFKLI